MTSEQWNCPIWGTPAISRPTMRDGRDMDSTRAGGRYFITGTASAILREWDELTKALLTLWLIEQRRLGVPCPEISRETLDEIMKRRWPTVHDRADGLLRYLSSKSELIGTVLKFYALDNAKARDTANELLAWTGSRQISEVITLAEYCGEEGWIEHRTTERSGSSKNTIHELVLRPPGFARLAALDGIGTRSHQAFVAMWFDQSMNDAYEKGVRPAIEDAGYDPVRIDRKDHNNKLDDEIIAEIRRSRFLVADFTQGESGARGGVYYEAGFAHGLNLPVIFTCHKATIEKVHFDTRQYNHIIWENPEELRDKLAKRISATIGDGPKKKVS